MTAIAVRLRPKTECTRIPLSMRALAACTGPVDIARGRPWLYNYGSACTSSTPLGLGSLHLACYLARQLYLGAPPGPSHAQRPDTGLNTKTGGLGRAEAKLRVSCLENMDP